MRQFIKFTVASCLGVFIALGVLFFLVFSLAISASLNVAPSVKSKSVLSIAPDYSMPEHTNNTQPESFSFQMEDIIGTQDLCQLIKTAKEDENIEGILLDPSRMQIGIVGLQDIVRAIEDFKSSGKFVMAYANYYEQLPYYLASYADTIILNPIGVVDFRGFASFTPFYKELLDKTGIKMQVYYAGEFKSATEPFRRTEMSPENKFQVREFLSDIYDQFLEDIGNNRNIEVARLREIADDLSAGNATNAQRVGLVDMVGYSDQAGAIMRNWMGLEEDAKINLIDFQDYYLSQTGGSSSGSDRIAVVYAEGPIVHAADQYGQISDKTYVDVLRDIRKSSRIDAVVLRVNSPGGNILAAENILREVKLLQETGKPFVVSMGDYAASGGYYISCTADSIFAERSTLTGSIGVFSMFPNPHALLKDKLGIGFDTVQTGAFSASFSPYFGWSEAEDRYLQSRTDEFYELFLNNVSEGRDRTVEEIHEIARGRVWSGIDAESNGLVDRVGTLEDAINAAAALADISDYRLVEYPRVQDPWTKMISEILGQDIEASVNSYVDSKLDKALPAYGHFNNLLKSREPMARLPFFISY